MAQPKAPSDDVPAALKPLVEQLATLEAADRERIVRAARRAARERRRRTISWGHLRDARGVVSVGGDAIEDTRALYDG
ncbi:MAG TPA: hypothetical protein VFK02_32260 [Kofleriaceae bacterium]|nr:hypothetical protein [Kofleriaceae bacterium]